MGQSIRDQFGNRLLVQSYLFSIDHGVEGNNPGLFERNAAERSRWMKLWRTFIHVGFGKTLMAETFDATIWKDWSEKEPVAFNNP